MQNRAKKHTAQTKNAAGKSETAQKTRKKTHSADEENGRPKKRSRRVNSVQGGRCLQNGAGAWRADSLQGGRCLQNGAGARKACWKEDAYRTERARGQLVGERKCTQACTQAATKSHGAAPEKEELGEPTADTLSKT